MRVVYGRECGDRIFCIFQDVCDYREVCIYLIDMKCVFVTCKVFEEICIIFGIRGVLVNKRNKDFQVCVIDILVVGGVY